MYSLRLIQLQTYDPSSIWSRAEWSRLQAYAASDPGSRSVTAHGHGSRLQAYSFQLLVPAHGSAAYDPGPASAPDLIPIPCIAYSIILTYIIRFTTDNISVTKTNKYYTYEITKQIPPQSNNKCNNRNNRLRHHGLRIHMCISCLDRCFHKWCSNIIRNLQLKYELPPIIYTNNKLIIFKIYKLCQITLQQLKKSLGIYFPKLIQS